MTEENENNSWLPNLVGGVSIWKLAPDLNEEHLFDGRLLVPETEGSDSLPARVEWDLTGLVPLPEARDEYPERVQAAIDDFFSCLERTAAVFQEGGSGFDRYKEAFTVPAVSLDDGAHYFFDPQSDALRVINWGASPRKIKHSHEYVFGYAEFQDLIRQEQEAQSHAGGAKGGGRAKGAASAMIVEGRRRRRWGRARERRGGRERRRGNRGIGRTLDLGLGVDRRRDPLSRMARVHVAPGLQRRGGGRPRKRACPRRLGRAGTGDSEPTRPSNRSTDTRATTRAPTRRT